MDKNLITVNLFDNTFRHQATADGIYSCIYGQKPEHIKYIHDNMNWDGITFFTDSYILKDIVKTVKSKYKIGWIIECNFISNINATSISNVINNFDYILTHDEGILKAYPNKAKRVPLAGSWIKKENWKLHNKNKNINLILSNKKELEGHRLRHSAKQMIEQKHQNVDIFGRGIKNFNIKEDVLTDYKFSIVIENAKMKNYFTEKLVDCLVTGTIPIYWGCPNIDEFFDKEGIVEFNTKEELFAIISNLNAYNKSEEVKAKNLETASQYAIMDDWIFKNILEKII